VAGNEPVTSPDQHKPGHAKAARFGAVVTILILLAMLFGRKSDPYENAWLIGLASLIALILVGDWVLRKNGLRS
jgi:ABC-type nickel/cobalt efflux system permease component RcnA